MKYSVLILSVIAFCFVALGVEEVELPVKVLVPGGVYHGDEIKHEGGAGWWGLVKEGDGFVLRKTTVNTTKAYDAIINEEGKMTGKEVACDLKGGGVVFVKT